MGAWGTGAFDNDTACDWAYELEEASDLSAVRNAIEGVIEVGDGYLDSDIGCEALAACEVIARLKGNCDERNEYTETVDAWVDAHPMNPPDDLVEKATRAIDRILLPDSELLELWEEGEDFEEWRASVVELRRRVAS